jgi:hypothetical protein
VRALLDSGSSFSVIRDDLLYELQKNSPSAVRKVGPVKAVAVTASGEKLNFTNTATLHIKIQHLSWDCDMVTVPHLATSLILGYDFLVKSQATLDFRQGRLNFPYGTAPICLLSQPQGTSNLPYKLGSNLQLDQIQKIVDLVNSFPNTITPKLGKTNLVSYQIKLKSEAPIRCRPYQFSPPRLRELRQHVDQLLEKGVIRKSHSEFSSPAFLVPKKDGKSRLVVNYKRINDQLHLDSMPVPSLESAFQYLGKAKWFSLLDLNSAYNQIPLTEDSKKYTAFVTPFQLFEYNFVPFGLSSGGSALNHLIETVLGHLQYKTVFCFFDDVVVFSNGSFDEHLVHLKEVLDRLKEANLTVNPSKMNLATDNINFLGHVFANNSITISNDRVQPILDFPPPKNLKQLSKFLGGVAFYSRFFKNFAQICQPLNWLKRKGVPFHWKETQQAAFDTLKRVITTPPVLKMPDFEKEFVLQTDASGLAVGAQLLQEYNGVLHPVAYASRLLDKHEINRSTVEVECIGVVYGLKKFQQYLEHREFQLNTDNSALTYLLNHPRQVGKIARWITFINSFKFRVTHIPATQNAMSDFLSRMYDSNEVTSVPLNAPQGFDSVQENPKVSLPQTGIESLEELRAELREVRDMNFMLFEENKKLLGLVNQLRDNGPTSRVESLEQSVTSRSCTQPLVQSAPLTTHTLTQCPPCDNTPTLAILFKLPEAFTDIKQHQRDDPHTASIVKNIVRYPEFSLQDGVLLHTNPKQKRPRVVLPNKLFDMVFSYFHQAPSSAHLGIKKTCHKIGNFFWANDLAKVMADKVKACVDCQRSKQAQNTRLGHLSSEITTEPWSKIFIDHVGPLVKSPRQNMYLLTVVDAFTKFTILIPVKNTKSVTTVNALTKNVFSVFGFPKFLVSDNVPNMKSRLIADMCLEYGIQHIQTSPYYPPPSHAERVNKNLKVALRIFHSQNQQSWDQNIHWFQLAFNTAIHESLQATPASLFFGRELQTPLDLQWKLSELTHDPANNPAVQERWGKAIESLGRAREKREKQYRDRNLPNPFKVGDWVMFREHHLSNAANKINYKLLPLWSRPCVIGAFTSPVTAQLIDPKTGRFVRTAHVSQLKRFFMPKY